MPYFFALIINSMFFHSQGSDSHYGTSGNRAVTVDLHGSGKITFQFSYSSGCNNGTCVEDGQIPEIIFCI